MDWLAIRLSWFLRPSGGILNVYLFNERLTSKKGDQFKSAGKACSGEFSLTEDPAKSVNRFDYAEMDLDRAATLATILAGPATGVTRTALMAIGFTKDVADVVVQQYANFLSGKATDQLFEATFKRSAAAKYWGLASEIAKARWDDLIQLQSSEKPRNSGLGRCHQCLPTSE
jgi:hypothetical protein